MILSSPFSRQQKSHQSWHAHNGTANQSAWAPHQNGLTSSQRHAHPAYSSFSLRKPAPQHSAPRRPEHIERNDHNNNNSNKINSPKIMVNGKSQAENGNFRSSTLNRLDVLRARQRQQQQQQQQIKRNNSSLGNYPALEAWKPPTSGPANATPIPGAHTKLITPTRDTPIYAPASIASPRELAHFRRGAEQHYASASVRGDHSAASFELNGARAGSSQPGARSGRESALSGLFEKFGTLKRKARRHWPAIGSSSSRSSSRLGAKSGSGIYATPNHTDDRSRGRDDKKALEAEQIYAEGLQAIDGNGQRRLLEHELEPALMQEGETRTLIDEDSTRQADFSRLVGQLTGWINDELAEQRIIVRDLCEDLYDGQVLCKLIERLQGVKLDIVEVTQNELAQKYKLKTMLDAFHRTLALQARWARIRWSIEGIHGKNLVEIIHLLVTLALYYQAPIKMPANVQVGVHVFQKHADQLIKRSHRAQLTDELLTTLDLNNNNSLAGQQRDAFDLLIECAPQKLGMVKQTLLRFCNRHLSKISMSCSSPTSTNPNELEPDQFSDGLLLVFLISTLEDFFVPLGNLFTSIKQESLTANHHNHNERQLQSPLPFIDTTISAKPLYPKHPPTSFVQTDLDDDGSLDKFVAEQPTALEPTSYINTQPIEKLHNVNVALQLIEEAGVSVRQRVRAEDVVNGDLKAVLRVLYALFSRYKHL